MGELIASKTANPLRARKGAQGWLWGWGCQAPWLEGVMADALAEGNGHEQASGLPA